jgi:hypothetical protein
LSIACQEHSPKCRPGKCRGAGLVEAAGQLILIFRKGLDYTFILLPGCGACYPKLVLLRILVPARPLGSASL